MRLSERRKATRVLKKLQKQASALSPSSPERTLLLDAIHDAEVDLSYTIYHPLTEKYRSLYPRSDEKGSEEGESDRKKADQEVGEVSGKKPPIWNIVESSMAEGTLEDLRDGKIGRRAEVIQTKPTAKQEPRAVKKGKEGDGNDRDRARAKYTEEIVADEDDALSDGGFFEK